MLKLNLAAHQEEVICLNSSASWSRRTLCPVQFFNRKMALNSDFYFYLYVWLLFLLLQHTTITNRGKKAFRVKSETEWKQMEFSIIFFCRFFLSFSLDFGFFSISDEFLLLATLLKTIFLSNVVCGVWLCKMWMKLLHAGLNSSALNLHFNIQKSCLHFSFNLTRDYKLQINSLVQRLIVR